MKKITVQGKIDTLKDTIEEYKIAVLASAE